MPRKRRFYLPGIPVHVIQRGNSRQPVFFESDDYQAYLGCLKEGANKHGCAIHAYSLMTNHLHLLLTPESSEAISKIMQFIGRHYVPHINNTHSRSGTLR
ncbi:MAG: transposase [Candidatus Thiodiazotropha weberae]|nr:transposase [Candidatus Thiodiazotropha lotti]MCG8011810.1 transposase [Candidatus Thiodiazotropha lotti]MCG8021520.1 transposase [Candidatus Thiodiazotropha lotti]MCW4208688.1 transposase [Candidatus Thiodiazotropha lotti]MCW4211276.1 transposase [Candidatus Thiodiazotropha lotti]